MTPEQIELLKIHCPDAICMECNGEGVRETTLNKNSDLAEYAAQVKCGFCYEIEGVEPGYENEFNEIIKQYAA